MLLITFIDTLRQTIDFPTLGSDHSILLMDYVAADFSRILTRDAMRCRLEYT